MTAHNPRPGSTPDIAHAIAVVRRDEWLLDEAIMETFPASDPVAPYQHASDERTVEPAAADEDEGQANT